MAVIQPFETALVSLINSYRNNYPKFTVSAVLEAYCDIVEKDETWLRQVPLPVLGSISPATAVHGGADLTMTATGSGFTSASVIVFNGVQLTTAFVSDTSLTATVKPSLFTAAGGVPVTVNTFDGQASAPKTFTFT
jgi:hypothetical protein